MRDYYKWCVELLNNWKQKNVENIVNLFDENVEYYETPTEQINTIKEIRKMWEEIEEEQKETQSDKSSLEKEIYCKNNKNKMKKYSADVVKPWSKWTEEDYNLFKKKFDENIKIPENLSSLSRWLKLFVQVVQKRSWFYRMDVAWI